MENNVNNHFLESCLDVYGFRVVVLTVAIPVKAITRTIFPYEWRQEINVFQRYVLRVPP
jgi:hypothetical protein